MRNVLTSAAIPFLVASVCLTALPSAAQQQEGLVNVAVGDVTVQVPIAVAANVCGIEVNALAQKIKDGEATCTATPEAAAGNEKFLSAAEKQGVQLPPAA